MLEIDLRKHATALHFVQPGSAVIDAGAFIGSYSFFYQTIVGPRGLIIAYEPQPRAIQLFKTKLQKKNIHNIEIREKVASSTDTQKIAMKIYLDQIQQSCTVEPLLMNEERMPGNTTILEVETERLDTSKTHLQNRKLSLIKIDTEGHESEVLRGAVELIQVHQPLIFMEYGFIPGNFEPDTIAQVQALGYTCFDLKTLKQVEPGYISYLPTDLIAVPYNKLDAFCKFSSSHLSRSLFLKGFICCSLLKIYIRKIKEKW